MYVWSRLHLPPVRGSPPHPLSQQASCFILGPAAAPDRQWASLGTSDRVSNARDQRAAAPGIESPHMRRPPRCDHPVECVPRADGQDKAREQNLPSLILCYEGQSLPRGLEPITDPLLRPPPVGDHPYQHRSHLRTLEGPSWRGTVTSPLINEG